MTHIVAVGNQKGGVGKTTTVVNLAGFFAVAGRRTLVVDCDPQGNASSALGCAAAIESSIFSGGPVRSSAVPGLSVVANGSDLHDQEKRLARAEGGRFALRQVLQRLPSDFDIILIDCPPSLSLLSLNALYAADRVLIPIQSEYFAMEGLGQMLAEVDYVQQEGHDLQVAGILLTMFEDVPLAREVSGELRRHFAGRVLSTTIPRDVALAAAPSHGKTILDYDPLSQGSDAYLRASKEVMNGLR